MGSNIEKFLSAKDYDPRLIVNPDSMVMNRTKYSPAVFHGINNIVWDFKTLDNKPHMCRVYNKNYSGTIIIYINDTKHRLDPVINTALFTFDARFVLLDNTIIDYEFVSYPFENLSYEKFYENSVEVASPPFMPFYCNFGHDGVLETKLRMLGFNLNSPSACSTTNQYKSIEWKFRSRVDQEHYASVALYEGSSYLCSGKGNPLEYYNRTQIDDMSGMRDWLGLVFG